MLDIESLIWEIEDHPFNLIGADLKNINSSHLIDFEENPNKQKIDLIKSKFYTLFPLNTNKNGVINTNGNKLKNILLFYGKYWEENWASYYWRYDFGNWEKIVRSIDIEGEVFKSFFKDYLENDINQVYTNKVILDEKVNFDTFDKLEIFKWYAAKLHEEMWCEGKFLSLIHI